MPTTLIELTTDNQSALDQIAEGVFDHPLIPEQLEAFLSCPRHTMAIAIHDGLVVGMASAVEYFHPDKKPQLWINEVAVAPDFQNRQIGRRLVRFIIDIGRSRGCVAAWLGTDVNNIPGQKCFGSVANGHPPSNFRLYEWSNEDQFAERY